MRILLDVLEPTKAGVPSRLAFVPRQVIPHSLIDTLGELLDAAEAAGFDVLVTVDRGFRYEQNLAGRKIAVVIFRTKSIALKDLLPHAP